MNLGERLDCPRESRIQRPKVNVESPRQWWPSENQDSSNLDTDVSNADAWIKSQFDADGQTTT